MSDILSTTPSISSLNTLNNELNDTNIDSSETSGTSKRSTTKKVIRRLKRVKLEDDNSSFKKPGTNTLTNWLNPVSSSSSSSSKSPDSMDIEKNESKLSSSTKDKEEKEINKSREQKDENMNVDSDDFTKSEENSLKVEVIDANNVEIIKNKNEEFAIILSDNNDKNKNNVINIVREDKDEPSIKTINSSLSEKLKAKEKEPPKIGTKSRVAAMRTKRKSKSEDKKEEDKKEEENVETRKPARARSSKLPYTSKRKLKAKDIQYLELSDDE
ncbi:hypothetical protein U3516DRAFT_673796 [Neocallimastix sp. 'constans']